MRWPAPARIVRFSLAVAAPLWLLSLALTRLDVGAGLARLAAAGPWLALAPLPFALVMLLDALGWQQLLPKSGARGATLAHVLHARLAGEAVTNTLPTAGIAGEAASAWLLSRRTPLPLGPAIGTLAVRRVLLAWGHSALLAAAALAAWRLPLPQGALLLGGASAGLAFASLAGTLVLAQAAPFARLQALLSTTPCAWLRSWTHSRSGRLREADREALRLILDRPRLLGAAACFSAVFVAEALESLVLLRLVGASVRWPQVLTVEPLASLVRALAFFVPAGLGFQDLGYVSLLGATGVEDAAGVVAAFLLLKRGKELAWTAAGWCVLLAADVTAPAERAREPGTAADPLHLRVHEPDDTDAPDRARAPGA